MEPAIGRSLVEGFRAANKSVAGMGFFAGISILLIVMVILGVVLANPPQELFQRPGAGLQEPPVTEEPAIAANVAVPLNETTSPEKTTAPGVQTNDADLFQDLSTAEETGTPAHAEPTPPPPTPTPEEVLREQQTERNRVIGEWLSRVWPLLLLFGVVLVAAGTWLSGGQLGYVIKRVTTQQADVSEFWITGTRAFGALLGASAMAWVGFVGLGLAILAIGFLFALLSKAVPTVGLVILGLLLGLAAVVGLVWILVKLSFWFVAIVAERLGPLAGFKASLRITRGRWWPLFGLWVLVLVISFAARLPFGLLNWIGGLIGGGAALICSILATILGALANLYVGFATLGTFVRFYEDVKSTPASASPSVQP